MNHELPNMGLHLAPSSTPGDPRTAHISCRRPGFVDTQPESTLLKIFGVQRSIQLAGTWPTRVLKKPLITAGQRRYHCAPT